jgi:hypothetical protein
METAKHQEIAERAYALWEQEGRPDGRNAEHWRKAEQELTKPSGEARQEAPSGSYGTQGARGSSDAPARGAPSPRKPTLATRRGRRISAD